jgi:hypothetical protein
MSGGDVRLALHDGETLTIAGHDVTRVYENLWRLAPKPGAVTLAGVLVAVKREPPGLRRPVDLTESQTAVILEAIAMPDSGA